MNNFSRIAKHVNAQKSVCTTCTTVHHGVNTVHGADEKACAPRTTCTVCLEDTAVRCTVHVGNRGADIYSLIH